MNGFMPCVPTSHEYQGQKLHSPQYHFSWNIFFSTWLSPALPLGLCLGTAKAWKASLTARPKPHSAGPALSTLISPTDALTSGKCKGSFNALAL